MSEVTFTPEQQAHIDRIIGERLARAARVGDEMMADGERRAQFRDDMRVIGASVTREERVYGLHSQNSYYSDVVLAAQPDNPGTGAARSRLGRYERELGVEMDRGSKEGRRAERIIRARLRTGDEVEHEQRATKVLNEIRGFGTDGGISASSPGEAAPFVSPAFLLDQWAPYRGAARSFADQCLLLPLPAYGMKIYVPYFSGTDKVGEQTEGGTVTETAPTAELEGSPTVATITGQITGSQQLHDRGGTGGGTTDVIIGKQLQQQLDSAVDLYALNRAIEQGSAISGEATYSTKGLYKDLSLAREKITDTPGTRLRPTHLFTTSDLYSYASDQVDTSERPILQPQFVPGFPLAADADDHDDSNRLPKWARFTGTVLPGGVLWFTDDNIPLEGTTTRTRLLVSSPGDAIIVLEDEPVLTVFIETKADKLQTILNLREYAAAVTRHSAGTSVVSGAAYTSSLH